jgi:general secretion pathway protein E
MVDQGVEPYLVSSSLILVIAQRLVRTVCKHCKEMVPVTDEHRAMLAKLNMTPDDVGGMLPHGKGCDDCFGSGYAGRTAIYEFMPVDEVLRTEIMDGSTASQMKRSAIQRGVRTLRRDGIDKIIDGHTTPDEILRVTQIDLDVD